MAALGEKFPAFRSATSPASTVSLADALTDCPGTQTMNIALGESGAETPASMPGWQ